MSNFCLEWSHGRFTSAMTRCQPDLLIIWVFAIYDPCLISSTLLIMFRVSAAGFNSGVASVPTR